ncbi:MAG: hypothetical protein KDE14_04275 [Rhodobacteraceae bacterium]|nr:hypothetical protein [Paracoccaceae bacterium]
MRVLICIVFALAAFTTWDSRFVAAQELFAAERANPFPDDRDRMRGWRVKQELFGASSLGFIDVLPRNVPRKGSIVLRLNDGDVVVNGREFDSRSGRDRAWSGNLPGDVEGSFFVSMRGQNVFALLRRNGGLIYICPDGFGGHLILRIDDWRKYVDHRLESIQEILRNSRTLRGPRVRFTRSYSIKVHVVYTPAVAAVEPDIEGYVQSLIQATNLSFSNSGIGAGISQASGSPRMTQYQEGSDPMDAIVKLYSPTDGFMDEVLTDRDDTAADIVILLAKRPTNQWCGLSMRSPATSDTAFSIVNYACGLTNLSFAHEIGHQFGADHDIGWFTNGDTAPYPFGHGFVDAQRPAKSVMGVSCESCLRLDRWSVPPGFGVSGVSENVKVMNMNAPTIAGFR